MLLKQSNKALVYELPNITLKILNLFIFYSFFSATTKKLTTVQKTPYLS